MSVDAGLSRERVALNGGEIAMLLAGRDGAPPLLFAHANGFCASAYRQMLAALGDRFDVFAVDLRGHGRTTLSVDPGRHRSMDIFGEDISDLLDSLSQRINDGAKWTLAGHSLGAIAVTLAAAGRRDVARLRLIEPVAAPFYWPFLARTPFWRPVADQIPLVKAARGRRAAWPDRASAKASYARKSFFSSWSPGVLDDYLEDGLRETDAGVALSCAPAWEAATYRAQSHDFWRALVKAPAPVAVLAARHKSTTVSAGAARRFARLGATIVRADGWTHLLPFEAPEAAAHFIAGDRTG